MNKKPLEIVVNIWLAVSVVAFVGLLGYYMYILKTVQDSNSYWGNEFVTKDLWLLPDNENIEKVDKVARYSGYVNMRDSEDLDSEYFTRININCTAQPCSDHDLEIPNLVDSSSLYVSQFGIDGQYVSSENITIEEAIKYLRGENQMSVLELSRALNEDPYKRLDNILFINN